MTRLSLFLIRAYQHTLAHLFHLFSRCRFVPDCSHYGYAAIELHGWRRGWWLAARRVGRCNPFTVAGYDPVPATYVGVLEGRRRRRAAAGARKP